MINISGAGQQHSRIQALIVLTDNADKVSPGRTCAVKMKEGALIAMMAMGWSTRVVKAVWYRALRRLFCRIRNEEFGKGEYILFRDMIFFATDAGVPLEHTQRNLRRTFTARYHLFEIADMRRRAPLIDRLDTRGLRTPLCLHRVPFSELIAADWELEHPDMILMLRQAARSDPSPMRSLFRAALLLPRRPFRPLSRPFG